MNSISYNYLYINITSDTAAFTAIHKAHWHAITTTQMQKLTLTDLVMRKKES
jgi:hypothetical protein